MEHRRSYPPPKLTCIGSTSTEAGLVRSSVGLSLARGYAGRIDLDSCDFGEGANANGVDLLWQPGEYDWFTNDMNGWIEGTNGSVR